MLEQFIPEWLRLRLAGRDTVKRVAGNTVWLSAEQALRTGIGLVVGVWVARYLGPEQYGWLSYALAVVATVGPIASLGLNAVVVRELVRSKEGHDGWMGTAFFLRTIAATAAFLVCVVVAAFLPTPTDQVRWLIVVASSGLVIQVFDVADLLFQSRSESRVSAWVRMTACVAGATVRVALLLLKAPLMAFVIAGVLELAVASAGWLLMIRKRGWGPRGWRVERANIASLLREGWPLAFSGLAISAQAYLDQVLIGAMLEAAELGKYAAAVRLISVFAFIPMVVLTASAPEITRAREQNATLYRVRLHKLYRVMFGLFVVTAIPVAVAGPFVATWLYGPAYAGTAALLPWLALRLFFTNFGVARSAFIVNEGLFRFSLTTAVAGAVTNLILNIILLPRLGALGAIASSLASFAVTTFALEGFNPKARGNLRLMVRAIFLPWLPFPSKGASWD